MLMFHFTIRNPDGITFFTALRNLFCLISVTENTEGGRDNQIQMLKVISESNVKF